VVALGSHGGAGSLVVVQMTLLAAVDEGTSSSTCGRGEEKWKGKLSLLGLVVLAK